ncbi:RDD family protein [Aliikangiella sp. IMCC44632]
MSDNVYQAPESDIINHEAVLAPLASRWARLGASLIDTIILMCVLIPLMFMTGGLYTIEAGIEPSLTYNLMISALLIVAFVLINGAFLVRDGQTLGKKLLGIKITDMQGNLATKNHLIKRYAVYFLPGQIPVVGQFFSIVNILFIFGKEKRCIHDLAGGTQVIDKR